MSDVTKVVNYFRKKNPSLLFGWVLNASEGDLAIVTNGVGSSHRRCSVRKVFLAISQNSQKTSVPESLF